MDFIKPSAEFDVIGFGEVMLRLSPVNQEKISHSESFEKNAGGSEFNVACGCAQLGVRSGIITKLPNNKVGRFIRNKVRYGGVSDDFILYDDSLEKRLGIYYYETGAYPRKSSVVYDRAHSSFTSLSIDEIVPDIFKKPRLFHISGISLALDETLREESRKLIRGFKEAGVCISFDVNYRAALWDEDTARSVIEEILPHVDILFVSEETSRRMLRRTGSLEEIMAGYNRDYGCKIVATTRREAISPTRHNFTSKIYYDGRFYEEHPYENIEVVDRIGSGDAYLSGALFAVLRYGDIQKALEFGNAMSAVKNTIYGDMPVSSLEEIQNIIAAHKADGPQDELVR